jgi:hypothetical protein
MGQPRMDNQETKATLDTRHRTKTNKREKPTENQKTSNTIPTTNWGRT